MGNTDRSHRRELLRKFADAEHEAARRRLGLEADQLRELLDHLDAQLQDADCDHTLGHTKAWLAHNYGKQVDVLTALAELGGYCDCEVLANVTPDKFGWRD